MTQEQVEGNKIIAEFMGVPLKSKQITFSNPQIEIEKDRMFRYHSSWDWIMPVIENIVLLEESEFNYDAEGMSQLRMSKLQFKALSITNSIDIIFNSVVAFCKWYNQNKQK